ncbi:MAG TPA: DUF3037 domain-containing protein, partial [Casimicrobiaceae bacterium]
MKRSCHYAIVRFLPFVETGEFANVGVVLICPEDRYFGARLMERRFGRVTQFFEGLEGKTYREAVRMFREELRSFRSTLKSGGPLDGRKKLDASLGIRLFDELTRPRESLLRFSEVRTTIAEDPEAKLLELFAFYVERNFVTKEYQELVLDRAMRSMLRVANLHELFIKAEVGTDDFHVTIPFVHIEGDAPQVAIKPLNLNYADTTRIYDHGGHWVDRVNRL